MAEYVVNITAKRFEVRINGKEVGEWIYAPVDTATGEEAWRRNKLDVFALAKKAGVALDKFCLWRYRSERGVLRAGFGKMPTDNQISVDTLSTSLRGSIDKYIEIRQQFALNDDEEIDSSVRMYVPRVVPGMNFESAALPLASAEELSNGDWPDGYTEERKSEE